MSTNCQAACRLPYCLLPPGGAVSYVIPFPGEGAAGSLAEGGVSEEMRDGKLQPTWENPTREFSGLSLADPALPATAQPRSLWSGAEQASLSYVGTWLVAALCPGAAE